MTINTEMSEMDLEVSPGKAVMQTAVMICTVGVRMELGFIRVSGLGFLGRERLRIKTEEEAKIRKESSGGAVEVGCRGGEMEGFHQKVKGSGSNDG